MSEKRMYPGCAVFCVKIVVSGGERDTLSSKTVEVYDHCSNKWSRMPDMLERRTFHASVGIKNKLYMIGGSSKECEVFDSFSQKFSYIKSAFPCYEFCSFSLFSTKYATISNTIRIYVGRNSYATVLDVETEEWSDENGIKFRKWPLKLFYC